MAAGPAYAAFISYSRAVDGRLAPRLQSALERFGKPWYRLRAIRVFRDDASLSANPGLWSSLTGALERAEYFVLLASPGSAASEWVNREVEYWLAHRDRARLLLVLTEGEIAWDEHAADFDWARATAVPRALVGRLRRGASLHGPAVRRDLRAPARSAIRASATRSPTSRRRSTAAPRTT